MELDVEQTRVEELEAEGRSSIDAVGIMARDIQQLRERSPKLMYVPSSSPDPASSNYPYRLL